MVHVQNKLAFYRLLPKHFNPNFAEQFVKPRRTVTREGDEISEWSTSIADVESFVSTVGKS